MNFRMPLPGSYEFDARREIRVNGLALIPPTWPPEVLINQSADCRTSVSKNPSVCKSFADGRSTKPEVVPLRRLGCGYRNCHQGAVIL